MKEGTPEAANALLSPVPRLTSLVRRPFLRESHALPRLLMEGMKKEKSHDTQNMYLQLIKLQKMIDLLISIYLYVKV